MKPRPVLDGRRLQVLLAVIAEHEEHGHVTVRAVGKRVGFSSHDSAFHHLCGLRDAGWIAWESGKAGTMRPLVRRVA